MNDYQSSEFLRDGSHVYEYEKLNYQEKLKILSVIALEKLSNSLDSIAKVQGLSENVEDLLASREELQAANDSPTERVTTLQGGTVEQQQQLVSLHSQISQLQADKTLLQASLNSVSAGRDDLQTQLNNVTARLNSFESLVRQIDTLTDEAVG